MLFRACQVLNKNLPACLKDPPKNMLDEEGKKSYNNLMKNLNEASTNLRGAWFFLTQTLILLISNACWGKKSYDAQNTKIHFDL